MIIIGLQYFLDMYRVYGFSKRVFLRGNMSGLVIQNNELSLQIDYILWPRSLEIKVEEKYRAASISSNLYIMVTRKKINKSFKRTLDDLFNDDRIEDYTKQIKISEDECVRIIPQIGQAYYPPVVICKI